MDQGLELLEWLVAVTERSARRHVQKPPRLLFATGFYMTRKHTAYRFGLQEAQRIASGFPVLPDVVNSALATHSAGFIDNEAIIHDIERSAYPIPEGQTYLVKHLHDGIFIIIEPDGEPGRAAIQTNNGTD